MRTPRSLGFPALALVVIVVFSACSNSATPSPSGSGAPDLGLVTPGQLTIGYFDDPPVISVENGQIVGYQAYEINDLATKLGLKPTYVPYQFAALVPALQAHRIDIIAAGFSLTQPRAQVMYVSPPCCFGSETMIVKPGNTITSWQDAATKGWTLVAIAGSYQIGFWEALKIHYLTVADTQTCLNDVIQNVAQGCAIGSLEIPYLKATQPNSPGAQLTQVPISGPGVQADLNNFAVAHDRPALANAIAQALTDEWRDGTIDKANQSIFKGADYSTFITPPVGQAMYLPGPWEPGVIPPTPTTYPSVTPVSAGNLTVGITGNTPMLSLSGSTASGPEATILTAVAGQLGLKLKVQQVSDDQTALNNNTVDLVAGQLAATPTDTKQFWMTTPIGFNPDYIYVKPASDGTFPTYTDWEDVAKAGGKLAVVAGDPRIADLTADKAPFITVNTPVEGLQDLINGTVLGFVGSTVEYAQAASSSSTIAGAGIGWVRNGNDYTVGQAYSWGVKAGNDSTIDALNQAIAWAWQNNTIANAYSTGWPGANDTALEAPGPAAIGTSFGSSKDYEWIGMFAPGPWLERPGYVQP